MNFATFPRPALRARFLGLFAAFACLAGVSLHASGPITKMYLEIKGVTGDVTDPGYEGQIEVLSFTFSVTPPAHGGSGKGSGRVDPGGPGEFSITKYVDSSSPVLFQHAVKGTEIKAATLSVIDTIDGKPTSKTKFDFKDLIISSYHTGSSGEGIPLESISFNFAHIKITYEAQK